MEGLGLVTYAAALKAQSTGELIHAELLANRISELNSRAPSNPTYELECKLPLTVGHTSDACFREASDFEVGFGKGFRF